MYSAHYEFTCVVEMPYIICARCIAALLCIAAWYSPTSYVLGALILIVWPSYLIEKSGLLHADVGLRT